MQDWNRSRMLTRERFGMTLCILAVACLSSVIVQWSKHFPERETALETSLFGDLIDESSVHAVEPESRPSEVLPGPTLVSADDDRRTQSVTTGGLEIDKPTVASPSLLIPRARFTDPVDAEPSSIRTVSHSEVEAAGWLSGQIEELDSQSAIRAKSSSNNVVQLGTIIPE